MKHPHYDVIVAWAAGQTIQHRPSAGILENVWMDWTSTHSPTWDRNIQYRIKPEPRTSSQIFLDAAFPETAPHSKTTRPGNGVAKGIEAVIKAVKSGELS